MAFLKTVLVHYVSNNVITSAHIPDLAKYDVLAVNRFSYNDNSQDVWADIKAINPSIQIYMYQDGPHTNSNSEATSQVYLNNISRYTNARSHSMGSLNGDNAGLFLLDTDDGFVHPFGSTTRYLLDIGTTDLSNYWLEATNADVITQNWMTGADGIFIDNVVLNNVYGTGVTLKKYTTAERREAVTNYTSRLTGGLHDYGVKAFANRCNSQDELSAPYWLSLDAAANPPDIVMEETAFVTYAGPVEDDAQFFDRTKWQRQVDTFGAITNSDVAVLSGTKLTEADPDGTDNHDNAVNFWQALWYAMCSYHIARRNNPNNCYFMFSSSPGNYTTRWWFDEYDKIDLGAAIGTYTTTVVDSRTIYCRQFQRGYVFVNPHPSTATGFTLPEPGKRLSHAVVNDDFYSLPTVSQINIAGFHGEIIFTGERPPLIPSTRLRLRL